ncbi:MAG: hypothetical protein NZ550_02830 [Fimbriimonadales bacterium]|nr:hypothetical protein [Fimbriimonadales bacterium]MDW8051669.1 hypothetical protein [Armatimonadota bacterium]
MLRAKWSILALVVLVGIGGCERQAYTEEAARQAIAEQQERFHGEIEKGVQAAPPVVVGETPAQDSAPTQGGSKASAPGDTGIAVPPPPASAPAGASSTPSPAATQPSTLGEARYNPETRQYGIQPPGAPDNYTVPLGQPQGK